MEIKNISSEIRFSNHIVKEKSEKIFETNSIQKPSEESKKYREEDIKKATTDLNKFMGNSNTHLEYAFHEELKEHYIKLVSDDTNEIVREIPSKKILDIHAAMKEYLGFFVDKKI